MNNNYLLRYVRLAGLLLVTALLGGCPCPACDSLICGVGTMETMIAQDRTCVVTPISCGDGAHEQATGGQRECVLDASETALECGSGTHEQEQATGGQRECILGASTCTAGEIEVVNPDNTISCQAVALECAEGTQEQATGGQRECVPVGTGLQCSNGTHEQATGGQREECVPD